MRSKSPSVIAVEYDLRGRRARKEFDDAYAARRFFSQKMKAGRNPSVKSPTSVVGGNKPLGKEPNHAL